MGGFESRFIMSFKKESLVSALIKKLGIETVQLVALLENKKVIVQKIAMEIAIKRYFAVI